MDRSNADTVWTQALSGTLGPALALLLERADVAVSVKELAAGTYVHVNAPMAALFGRGVDAVLGQTDAQLLEPGPWATLRNAELAALTRGTSGPGELKLDIAGTPREFSVWRSTMAADPQRAEPTHMVSLWVENTQARRREAQLQLALAQLEREQRANAEMRRELHGGGLRDAVTGLATRAHFDDQLRREVDLSMREHREFALVEVSIDPPSEAARAGGDAARLRIVEALGRLLRSNTRAMDASCRWDDDRFAVLLSGVGLATAHSRMEQLRRQCATQIVVLDGRDLGFTVSMGVASFPHTASTREALLVACDEALTQARQRGGNTVALASIRFESI